MSQEEIYSKRLQRGFMGKDGAKRIKVMHDEALITGATVVYVLNSDPTGNHQSHKAFAVKEDALKYADDLFQSSLADGFELIHDPL